MLNAEPNNEPAARKLIAIYERDEKHNRLPALYEVLLSHAETDEARLEHLETLRALSAEQLSDEAAAFSYASRAFALAPESDAVRETVERSADAAKRHGELTELYLARLEAIEESAEAEQERLWLRRRVASLASDKLDQPEQAVDQLKQILEAKPDDDEAAEILEGIYRSTAQSRELRALLLHRVSHAPDEDRRLEFLVGLAQLEEDVLEDTESASARYRDILSARPDDTTALAALDRLSLAAGRWEELRDVLVRRVGLAEDEEERIGLTLRMGELFSDNLADPHGALSAFSDAVRLRPTDSRGIGGLERIAQNHPELAADADRVLESAYEARSDWHKLSEVLARRLDGSKDPEEQRALRLRYAELAGSKTGDAQAAYQALEDAFIADPSDVGLQDRLVEAAESAGQHEALATAFGIALEDDKLGDGERAALATRVAHLYDVILGRPEEARPFHQRVLAHDPLDERAFEALKELYTNAEQWEPLRVLYDERIRETVDIEAKLDLVLQVCFLYEELIDDPEQAIGAYNEVLEINPDHVASRRALERLYERTERWDGLAGLLRRELDQASEDERVGLMQRLGKLHETKLDAPDQALELYEQVLMAEPNHRLAREAIEGLMANASLRQRCARVLEPLYENRGDWAELCQTLEVQLEDLSDPGSRVALLVRLADLQENRLHDPSAAFRSIARAVGEDPADGHIREELARLSRMRDSERDRADVLEDALLKCEDSPSLASEILLDLAQLWDEHVGDTAKAESAYRRLITVDPDNAQSVLTASRALERIHLANDDHPALAEDLARQVELEDDVARQSELLIRLADLREDVLGDRDGAIATHRRRLELDPADVDAMRALERLYEQRESWPELIEVLRMRENAVLDEDEQRAVARRVAAIYEDELDDADSAIDAYNDVLSRFGQDHETLGALSRLYEEKERWPELLEVADMVYELAEDGPVRAAVRFQMGEIMRTKTGEVERSVEAFAEVLDFIPDHAGAIDALQTIMLADGTQPASDVPAEPSTARSTQPSGFEAEEADTTTHAIDATEGDAASDPPDHGALSRDTLDDADFGAEDLARPTDPPPSDDAEAGALEYPLPVRIEAARVLAPRFEGTADYPALLDALSVLAEADDPLERFRCLRRAAEVADVGLDDASRSFDLLGRAIRAGLSEDDLGTMLRDYRRLADTSGRWGDYASLLRDVGPDILDSEQQVHAYVEIAEVSRTELSDPDVSRRYYEQVLEAEPDHDGALTALTELTKEAGDHRALLDVLRRKTELADDPEARVELLLQRAELSERELEDVDGAIESYEQALADAQPTEAYVGLVRLYARAERWPDLASHYERMLDDGVGDPVDVRYSLGVVQLDRLEDAWAATDQFREALSLDVNHEKTIAALERLMGDEEHRATAAEILEPVFLQQMNWPKVTECLEARIAAEVDIDERKSHLTRLSQIHEDYLEDLDGALESYARLFREDPSDRGTWETLGRLARVLERHDRLAEIFKETLDARDVDDEDMARLAFVTGQLYDEKVGDLAIAGDLYGRALEYDPSDHGTFVALESVHTRRESWDALLALYRTQAQSSEEEADRIALLRKSARLLEERLEQPESAIETYRDILLIDPEDPNAIAALDELLEKEARWQDLAEHIRHQVELAAGDPDENDLKLRLGKVLEHRLDDLHGAIDVYEEITQDDPHHTDAVASLESLVQKPDFQVRIIEILEPIYLATDQWRKRIAVYEAQVGTGADAYESVRLLSQIAQLHEERANDLQLAFHAWARALAKEPDNADVRGQVDRIAAGLGTWDAHVSAYEQAIAATDDASVQADLIARMARVHDEQRGDPRAAIKTYERLLEIDSEDPTPLDSLEALHTMVGDWRGLVDVLQRKVQRSYDPSERGELLRRAGSVLEELLSDRAGAVEAYRSALLEDESDEIALESLDRLYEGAEDHENLAEIVGRRLEFEQDPTTRVELALRLGAIHEQFLRRPEDAIEAYQRAYEDDPQNAQAVESLAHLYERQAMWPELLDNLRLQASTVEDAGAEDSAPASRGRRAGASDGRRPRRSVDLRRGPPARLAVRAVDRRSAADQQARGLPRPGVRGRRAAPQRAGAVRRAGRAPRCQGVGCVRLRRQAGRASTARRSARARSQGSGGRVRRARARAG